MVVVVVLGWNERRAQIELVKGARSLSSGQARSLEQHGQAGKVNKGSHSATIHRQISGPPPEAVTAVSVGLGSPTFH